METIDDIRHLPELDQDTIHIWGVHVPDVLDRIDVLHAVLCNAEQEKAARFHREADRHSSIAARGALRVLLSGYTGVPSSELEFQYSENGKPSLVPQASRLLRAGQGRRDACDTIAFNVSHSGDWVVLAFGRSRQVGVDVEMIKEEMDVMPIASRYFTPEEAALIENAEHSCAVFFQLWARKEAYVKACGSGLFRELSSFSVPIENGRLPDRGEKDGWIFQRLEAGSKYASAVVTDKALDDVPCYDFNALKW
ncbi:4'-phosphopantetheinyl transferase family protein [Pontiella sulfatireligans]|uniref:4'-phosphopantetheinyl transferase sfp n=1 Tax=Pontiella sulfatireligans TaxID=2750658 RepID=A0A6C2UHY4_9BACT|nr:4'-phosphopantetheinyl transferase superfamily protein [Pontiella sulfatireligans]VGO19021.1 4'-phosphopantetheinyl transferase sfp [Pontiella sulfatireligans]